MRNGLVTLVVGAVLLGSIGPAAAAGAVGSAGAAPSAGAADAADGRANATALPPGETVVDEVTPRNATDWYAVDLDAGDVLRVVGSDGMGEVRFSIHGPDGAELDAREAGTNRAAVGVVAETDGTYYVRATTTESGLGGTYDLTAAVGSDDAEGVDDRSAATPVDGGFADATLVEDEEDWYAVEADAGDLVTASVRRTDAGETDLGQGFVVEVVSPSGERVGRVGADGAYNRRTAGTELVDASVDAAYQHAVADTDGTYYVRVVPVDAAEETVEGFVEYDVGVHARSPTRLAVDESVDGSIPAALDARGVYALDVNGTETLRVTAEGQSGGEFVVSVGAPNGSTVASASVANATTLETVVGTEGPAYVVTRIPVDGGAEGVDYTLSAGVPGRPAENASDDPTANGTDDNGTATPGPDANGTATPGADGSDGGGDGSAPSDGGGNDTGSDDGAGDGDDAGSDDDAESNDDGGAANVSDDDGTATPAATDAPNATTAPPTATATTTETNASAAGRVDEAATERAGAAGDPLTGSMLDGASDVTADGFHPLVAAFALLVGAVALLARR